MKRTVLLLTLLLFSLHPVYSEGLSIHEIKTCFKDFSRFREIRLLWELATLAAPDDLEMRASLDKETERLFIQYYIENNNLDISRLDLCLYQVIYDRLNTPEFEPGHENHELSPPLQQYYEKMLTELEQRLDGLVSARKDQDQVRYQTLLREAQDRFYLLGVLSILKSPYAQYPDIQPQWGIYRDQDPGPENIDEIVDIWIEGWLRMQMGLIRDCEAALDPDDPEEADSLSDQQRILKEVSGELKSISELKIQLYLLLEDLEYREE